MLSRTTAAMPVRHMPTGRPKRHGRELGLLTVAGACSGPCVVFGATHSAPLLAKVACMTDF